MKRELICPRPPKDKSKRRWRVEFEFLNSAMEIHRLYYRTKLGAKIDAWFKIYEAGWDAQAFLVDQRPSKFI